MSDNLASSDEIVDAICRDGGFVRLRPLGALDEQAVLDFYRKLDPTSLYRRFMTHTLPHDELLVRPLHSADPDEQVLGAEAGGELAAVALAVRDAQHGVPEVAFAVAKAHQGRGIGTLLLEHLAARARDRGITRFVATTMSSNLAMLDVFEQAGFRITETVDQGDVSVSLTLDERADEAILRREGWANAASMRRVLAPKSVAVIGASRRPGTVGHALLQNLLAGGFTGTIYAVNERAPSVLDVPTYPSVRALPEVPDLAIIAVPARAVSDVIVACAELGVAGAVIVTAGFSEVGQSGSAVEDELTEIARQHGMRIVGPNCVGIVNAHPSVRLNATFSPAEPVFGSIGFASQSGALGIAALDRFRDVDLGISSFVSLGNKADVSGNDLLQYWQHDPDTKVAALYLESFGNPRKFSQIARQFGRTKPIVAVKSGRSVAGSRAASSHTAAMASSDLIADVLFEDAGIIRVDTLAELFDVCRLVASQPIPAGRRIAIVGNSGGPGILAADACEAAGLEVPTLSAATQAALRAAVPTGAGFSNPVDLIASASAEQYEEALSLLLADEDIDAIVVIYTDPMVSDADDIKQAISRAAATAPKPIAANFLAADIGAAIVHPQAEHPPIPVYDFPEAAVIALGHAARLGAWRRRPVEPVSTPSAIDLGAAVAAVAGAAPTADPVWMAPAVVGALLHGWGIDLIPTIGVDSALDAAAAATRVGFPVALKVDSPSITHKTDVGGVRLSLATPAQVEAAYVEMKAAIGDAMTGAVVQAMAPEGIEVIVGGVADALFGPVVMFGAGGVAAEVWQDRAVALAPLTRTRAAALVAQTKIHRLLTGYRGAPPVDVDAIVDVLTRVGALLDEHPEVLELDLNPVIASERGIWIIDARCMLGPSAGPRKIARRGL